MVTSHSFRIYLLLLMSLCLLQGNLAYAALTASVDRNAISENDIINLTLRSTQGSIAQGIDFTTMLPDFTILNSQRNNQVRFINGQRSAHYDLILTLAPNRNGTLIIPAFSSNGESTTPITLLVTPGASDPQRTLNDVFIKTFLSEETVYVQQQVILTVKIYHAVGLSEANITAPQITNTRVQQLEENRQSETLIKGVRYSVIEQNYALFPQASGQLEIPEQILSGRTLSRVGNMFRSNSRFVRVKSKSITIAVLPKPDSYPPGAPWLPAKMLLINDSWDAPDLEIKAGEPATRTITLTAKGVTTAQLPPFQLPEVKGLKMYPDQPRQDEQATHQGLIAVLTQATAIVPTRKGSYRIPSTRIYWWNTDTDKLATSLIKEKNIYASAANVIPKPNFSESTKERITIKPAAQAHGVKRWLWPGLTGLFLLLWLVTGFLWWATSSRSKIDHTASGKDNDLQRAESKNQAYRQLCKTCRAGDMATARVQLLAWLKAVFSSESIQTLDDVRHLDCYPELTPILAELDATLYGKTKKDGPWDSRPLLDILKKIKKTAHNQDGQPHSRSLPPLYPKILN